MEKPNNLDCNVLVPVQYIHHTESDVVPNEVVYAVVPVNSRTQVTVASSGANLTVFDAQYAIAQSPCRFPLVRGIIGCGDETLQLQTWMFLSRAYSSSPYLTRYLSAQKTFLTERCYQCVANWRHHVNPTNSGMILTAPEQMHDILIISDTGEFKDLYTITNGVLAVPNIKLGNAKITLLPDNSLSVQFRNIPCDTLAFTMPFATSTRYMFSQHISEGTLISIPDIPVVAVDTDVLGVHSIDINIPPHVQVLSIKCSLVSRACVKGDLQIPKTCRCLELRNIVIPDLHITANSPSTVIRLLNCHCFNIGVKSTAPDITIARPKMASEQAFNPVRIICSTGNTIPTLHQYYYNPVTDEVYPGVPSAADSESEFIKMIVSKKWTSSVIEASSSALVIGEYMLDKLFVNTLQLARSIVFENTVNLRDIYINFENITMQDIRAKAPKATSGEAFSSLRLSSGASLPNPKNIHLHVHLGAFSDNPQDYIDIPWNYTEDAHTKSAVFGMLPKEINSRHKKFFENNTVFDALVALLDIELFGIKKVK